MFYHLLVHQVKYSTKRSVLRYQQDVWLVLIYCQQNYVLNLSKHKFIPRRVAVDFNNLISITSKVQRRAASIGFVKKALYQEVTPKFALVKGQFKTGRGKWKCEQRVMLSHLQDHKNMLKSLIKEYNMLLIYMINNYGKTFCNIITNRIMNRLRESRMVSLKTKNNKLKRLIELKQPLPQHNQVPIVNLTKYVLSAVERSQLELGLEYSFINKSKNQRKFLAANLESICQKVDKDIDQAMKEEFHEFLRGYTDIFIKNVSNTKDHTYNDLKRLIVNKNLCVLSGDKDSCVIIMNKQDYIQKLEGMLDEGIKRGTYERSTDTTKHDLETFQRFLYRNFKNHPSYDKMRPKSSQPARLYATAKTHKFNNLDEITVEKLKFRPIVDQIGTATYDAAKVISEYLKPLAFNEYRINDCLKFPDMIKALPPLRKNEEYVSYDVESLFTNIPLKETIDYIIHKIYNEKLLKPICKKLIFKRLLYKLTTDCKIQFNQSFYKQIDGCAMGGPLSVILADIHMVRTENEVVKPLNPLFYIRFVDDI